MPRSTPARLVMLTLPMLFAACTATSSGPATLDTGAITPASSTPASSTPGSSTVATEPATTGPATSQPATTQPVTTQPAGDSAALLACVTQWPLRDRIALLVWPSVYSDQWSLAESIVREQRVGGVVLMTPSDAFAEQLGDRLTELTALGAHGLAVATDEEGGAVQRLRALEEIPSQQDMSAHAAAEVTSVIERHARLIADAGIDVVLGPVVDVRPTEGDDPLGQGRLFAGDPQQVADLGALYVRAWQSAGLVPILKHFPGHGSASADTHQSLAVTPPLAALLERDLVPYRQLAGSGAGVMVGHLDVPGLTDGQPAGFSAAAVSLLRNELGWGDALVMTDALGMGAVDISVPAAAVRSLQAGVDVVIFTSTADTADVIAAIEQAVADGALTEADIDDSAVRVARLLAARGTPCVP